MKIAFIVGEFPVLSETFILNQITGLLDRGHDVDIYADRRGDLSKIHEDVSTYNLLEHTVYLTEIPGNYLWRVTKGLALGVDKFIQAPGATLQALNFFKYGKQALSLWLLYTLVPHLQKDYDIIHCQFGTVSFRGMAFRITNSPSAKLITIFRGHDVSTFVQERGAHIYEPLFKQGDYFLANCEFFKRRVINLGCPPTKIRVHGSGLDCGRFSFQARQFPQDGVIRLATTGRLVEKKGIEYSIRAVAQVLKKYANLEYIILGEGPLRSHLEHLIRSLDAEHSIKLLGQKSQGEVIELLATSHLFLAPSITAADGDQDAPVNVLKEAMAMGLPVISTCHGGIPELVQDGISGFLVPERDAEAIAQKLSYLLVHPERWPRMGQAGRTFVEQHYDLNRLNEQLVALYQSLLTAAAPQSSQVSAVLPGNIKESPMNASISARPMNHLVTQPLATVRPSPLVTLVVVPRERFSYARTSLESLYEHTQIPFNLVYVDGNSPAKLRSYLEEQAQQKGFKLIRRDQYLYPNQARNLGLQHVDTQYLVFVDNDVVVSPGWLTALVNCAEETNAAVVGPLMCQYEPIHQEVHFAGGNAHIWVDKLGRRRLREKMFCQGKRVGEIADQLKRMSTELAEFHCVLVRRSIFEQVGLLDEAMLNTKEHLDFCMVVRAAGETVYFEPQSLVTYVPGPPQELADVHYYMLRWSDAWTRASLKHMREKWNLAEDGYFQAKYKRLGWRRYATLIEPLARKLTFGVGTELVARAIAKLEHGLNALLTTHHAKQQKTFPSQPQSHPSWVSSLANR